MSDRDEVRKACREVANEQGGTDHEFGSGETMQGKVTSENPKVVGAADVDGPTTYRGPDGMGSSAGEYWPRQ